MENTKAGARNSRSDAEIISNIGSAAQGIQDDVAALLSSKTVSKISVKTLGDGSVMVEGYGVVFGGRDLTGDTFTAETDFGLDRSPVGMPVFYNHTLHPIIKTRIGSVKEVAPDDVGLFFQLELDTSNEYLEEILKLAQEGRVGLSTGTASHLMRSENNVIKSWHLMEVSLTTTPAEPRTLGVSKKMDEQTKSVVVETTETAPADDTKALSDKLDAIMAAQSAQAKHIETLFQEINSAPPEPSVKTIKATSDDDAVKAWGSYIRTGDRNAIKALQEGTDSEGGYLVPIQYSNELIAALNDESILRMAGARVITITGSDSFKVPALTNSTRAVKTSEEGAFSEVDPSLGEVTFAPTKYTRLVKVSDELLEDRRIDIMSQILMPDFAQAFAAAENEDFTTGDGVGDPQGVTIGASDSGVDTASATTITGDNIIDTYHALGYLYRQNAVWFMNDSTIKLVRKLRENGTSGNYLWQPGMASGQPDTLLGRPVYTLNTMPEMGTEGNRVIVFGDMRYFWIADFGNARAQVRRLDELYAGTGQVGFRAYKRIDSRVMLGSAIVYTEAGA